MPPPDARTDASTASTDAGTEPATAAATDGEDTLDLRLPDELVALITDSGEHTSLLTHGAPAVPGSPGTTEALENPEDPPPLGRAAAPAPAPAPAATADPVRGALLDHIATWGPVTTGPGVFQLVPVRLERDLRLISRWMNDPAVAAFWELAGPASVTEAHLLPQLEGDGRSVPCLGVLDGTPMSYWEIYRADLDPLARHYPARPHDTGIHLLVGQVSDRGRGLGSTLLRATADLVLDHRPSCARVVAEPDLRNTPSVSAFLSGGFRFAAEVDLPDKRAALMIRDRALRAVL
ncbi:GNAT family N-acetyltransferase [Streptomyces sp. p1417]|uniref:Lysine N-acyltransferase MbtK n=1 Tax=Streptomyces typhae TaxID=2681492 RepID=A0A6L6X7K5_9ACTN|nr:GNAT family N-acetyltransferase [Streptomyces typhae]